MGAVFNRDYPFNRGWKPLPPTINYNINDIELNVVSHERRLVWLIKKLCHFGVVSYEEFL